MRKSGYLIVRAKKGYTIRPKIEDYIYHLKLNAKSANSLLKNLDIVKHKLHEIDYKMYDATMKEINMITENRLLLENRG